MPFTTFKVYFFLPGQQLPEVRLLKLFWESCSLYAELKWKLYTMIPHHKEDTLTIKWKDQDGDYITISSPEEMMLATPLMKEDGLTKLYVSVKSQCSASVDGMCQLEGRMDGEKKPCIVCANCNGRIHYRY